ncbi:MAG: type IX secretion system membrane protein PorP/SprF [Paludibacter sp.]|nr:MAG: type IX secretion system membrane protein PorP/SprF [Paludibacter sp.]
MIKRFIHIVIVICFLFGLGIRSVLGQEFPWSLQYITNMHTINPAYVGMWDRAGLMLSTRSNWVGIKGAPLTQNLTYFTPIKDQKSGVGINIQRLNTGREKRLFLTGDYSYQVRLDMHYYLRLGLRAGILNIDNNLPDYQLYPDYVPDPEFTSDIRLYYMTVFGVGGVLYNEDYYVSLSIPQMVNNTFKVNRSNYSSLPELKTVYLSSGYVFRLPKSIRLRPNLLIVGTIGKPLYFDAAAVVYFPSDFQVGFNLRSNGAMCFSGQYTFKNNLRLGYAAEYFVVPDIRKYQLGTYEFIVGYDFNLYRKKYVKPNYF